MAGRVAFDTTFVIDFQRERTRGETDGPAHAFLASDPDVELLLPVTALGEFREGFDSEDDPVLRTIRELHVLLPVDEDVALVYGRVARALRASGTLIATNDLWIAATSIGTTFRWSPRTSRSSDGWRGSRSCPTAERLPRRLGRWTFPTGRSREGGSNCANRARGEECRLHADEVRTPSPSRG